MKIVLMRDGIFYDQNRIVVKPKLSWSDINLEKGMLTLHIRKGNGSTEFPLERVLLEIFRDLKAKPYVKANSNMPADQGYPFPFNASYVGHRIKAILNDADIDATAHDLRDSFVSHLIYLGYSLENVSKIAGDSTIKVTEQHYYGQFEEPRRTMLADLGRHMADQLNPSKTGTENRDIERSKVPNRDQSKKSMLRRKRASLTEGK